MHSEVYEGLNVLAAIEALETYNTRPISRVIVSAAGIA